MTPDINQILRKDPRYTKYGAPLGDRNYAMSSSPLYLQKIRFEDYDYAADGTYWGGSDTALWCAFNGDDEEYAAGHGTRIYVRAKTREEAKAAVLADFPDTVFKK